MSNRVVAVGASDAHRRRLLHCLADAVSAADNADSGALVLQWRDSDVHGAAQQSTWPISNKYYRADLTLVDVPEAVLTQSTLGGEIVSLCDGAQAMLVCYHDDASFDAVQRWFAKARAIYAPEVCVCVHLQRGGGAAPSGETGDAGDAAAAAAAADDYDDDDDDDPDQPASRVVREFCLDMQFEHFAVPEHELAAQGRAVKQMRSSLHSHMWPEREDTLHAGGLGALAAALGGLDGAAAGAAAGSDDRTPGTAARAPAVESGAGASAGFATSVDAAPLPPAVPPGGGVRLVSGEESVVPALLHAASTQAQRAGRSGAAADGDDFDEHLMRAVGAGKGEGEGEGEGENGGDDGTVGREMEDFSAMLRDVLRLKSSAQQKPIAERRVLARQVARAFWNAMSEDGGAGDDADFDEFMDSIDAEMSAHGPPPAPAGKRK